jgi:hypothetical protein
MKVQFSLCVKKLFWIHFCHNSGQQAKGTKVTNLKLFIIKLRTGLYVDPFQPQVSTSLFKGHPWFLVPVGPRGLSINSVSKANSVVSVV